VIFSDTESFTMFGNVDLPKELQSEGSLDHALCGCGREDWERKGLTKECEDNINCCSQIHGEYMEKIAKAVVFVQNDQDMNKVLHETAAQYIGNLLQISVRYNCSYRFLVIF